MIQEREGLDRKESSLPQIRAAINVASKEIFKKADENGVYNAVKRYREITDLTPWAECDLPKEAGEIISKYGQDPLFNFTWNFLNLTQDR